MVSARSVRGSIVSGHSHGLLRIAVMPIYRCFQDCPKVASRCEAVRLTRLWLFLELALGTLGGLEVFRVFLSLKVFVRYLGACAKGC